MTTIHLFLILCLNQIAVVCGETAWTVLPKLQVTGLAQISEIDLDGCLQVCMLVEKCNIVSFDVEADPPCWIEVNSSRVEKNPVPKDSVTTYFLERADLLNAKKCWTKIEGKTSESLFSATTTDAYICFLYCILLETCDIVAFDVKSRSPCWFNVGILGSIKEEDLIPMPNSVTYMLDRSCITSEGFENLNEI